MNKPTFDDNIEALLTVPTRSCLIFSLARGARGLVEILRDVRDRGEITAVRIIDIIRTAEKGGIRHKSKREGTRRTTPHQEEEEESFYLMTEKDDRTSSEVADHLDEPRKRKKHRTEGGNRGRGISSRQRPYRLLYAQDYVG